MLFKFNKLKYNFSKGNISNLINEIKNNKEEPVNFLKELESKISKNRLLYINLLVDSMKGLNQNEINILFNRMNNSFVLKNDNYLLFNNKIEDKDYEVNNNFLKENILDKDLIEKLGISVNISGNSGDKQDVKEIVEEVKEEKNAFDLSLKSFEPSKKLMLIKELKTIFNLGLKEAKELVEKSPVNLKKNVLKDEAEKIKNKLESIGCKIDLN